MPTVAVGKSPTVVITSGAAVTVIDRFAEAEAGGFSASLTFTVKLAVPRAVGLPEIAPVTGFRLSPAGSEPCVIDQVLGGIPPDAASFTEYETSAVAAASEVVVTVSGSTVTVIDRFAEAEAGGFSESLTCTVKLVVPPADGMPAIRPVVGTSVSPGGSEPCV